MDSSSFILVANCFSIAVLLSKSTGHFRLALGNWKSAILPAALILWAAACAAGLVLLTSRAWQIDIPERHLYYRAQLQNARAFMATDDIRALDHKPTARTRMV